MTKTIATKENQTEAGFPKIHYSVSMLQPETHLFEVTLQIVDYPLPIIDLKMPVWTPGSYLIREYARNLQDFAVVAKGEKLPWKKLSKNHWQLEKGDAAEVIVSYRVFANELSVRTNHLDASHGYFNGAALFLRVVSAEKLPIYVTIIPPHPEWQVTTALPVVTQGVDTFFAADFDTLVDSPFEIGSHQLYHFDTLGKSHELAIWGKGNFTPQQIILDCQKIIAIEAQMFDGLPYDRYVFILHLANQAYGGLEHKNSCSLIYHRFGFRDQDKYQRFTQLVAHEFFHLWNVKRIRPKALEVFDYDQESYTPSLWFCEGTTSYYDLLIPLRAGIYDAKSFLHHLGQEITRYQTTFGRKVQSLAESSFDTWIKLYRPDANSTNSQISYYIKGEMISLLLDLLIRLQHQHRRSLDDVMRQMWQQFGEAEIGYTPEQLKAVIESIAQIDLSDFFRLYIYGLAELPLDQYLEPFGLQLIAQIDEKPYLGIRTSAENGREMIKVVEAGSPAQTAGIDPGDELLAIDGLKVGVNQLHERLKNYQVGDTIAVVVFHQDELRSYSVTLATAIPTVYHVRPIEQPSPSQKENFDHWLGC
jgi:predicted metalloprotease with PDZ domain